MNEPLDATIALGDEVAEALGRGAPVVALESAVITHGLPRPLNLTVAREVQAAVRQEGATPATIALIDGVVRAGIDDDQLGRLAVLEGARKCSLRDLPLLVARGESGGTTVAGTAWIAHRAGLRVMATGGIGGVHRGAPFDVSADLEVLGETPIAVVSSGVKSFLDVAATAERLETLGVPCLGYRCESLPAFYVAQSDVAVTQRVDSVAEAATVVLARDELGMSQAVLLAVPISATHALSADEVERAAILAAEGVRASGMTGRDVTPRVLARMAELSGGRTLTANRRLLVDNARIAARLAAELAAR
jgi:pseudouridine-5'-phosphate glycosidase